MDGPSETFAIAFAAATAIGRPPVSAEYRDGRPVITWEPPLTAQEQAVVAGIVDARRSIRLEPSDWAAIRPHVQTLRDLRQMGRAAFMAQTAAERDRQLYDAQTATTIVLLALLRE